MRRLLFAIVLAAAFTGSAGPAEAKRVVPKGFFGTVLDGPLQNVRYNLSSDTAVMSRAGVESVRFPAYWHTAQPYPSFAEVPAGEAGRYRNEGGVPTNWDGIDRWVRAAAQRGLRSLPIILNPAPWARQYRDLRGSPPDPQPYARFAAALVRRYGPRGALWREYPTLRKVAVRHWQLLNEVNHTFSWNTPGADPNNIDNAASAPGYVALLRVTRAAIKGVDPGAKIVHAGIDSKSWRYVRAIYKAGGRRLFDVFAVHPFTDVPPNVLTILRYVRRAMNRARDGRKPMLVSEWSWPSSKGLAPDPGDLSRTPGGQAKAIGQTHRIFVRWRKRLRLTNVFYYSWMSSHSAGVRFSYAGLRNRVGNSIIDKPALGAFRRSALAYEGCRRKSSRSATRCLKRRR